jgi:hypothetical protein
MSKCERKTVIKLVNLHFGNFHKKFEARTDSTPRTKLVIDWIVKKGGIVLDFATELLIQSKVDLRFPAEQTRSLNPLGVFREHTLKFLQYPEFLDCLLSQFNIASDNLILTLYTHILIEIKEV